MKKSRDIYGIFLNKLSKLPTENRKTLFQREKMNETFPPSHDITNHVSNYWKWGKLLREQNFLAGKVSSY